jgi:hypothetical protein
MMEMERKMPINIPRAAQWARDVASQVLVSDAKVRELNGASGLATDMHGEPAQGLRPGYGRGGAPAAAQAGGALGALARNWWYTNEAKDDAIARRPSGKDNYPHHDKVYHCQGNCEAAKAGPVGSMVAAGASDYFKEAYDMLTGGSIDEADRKANQLGRQIGEAGGQCYEGCQHLDREWVVVPMKRRH